MESKFRHMAPTMHPQTDKWPVFATWGSYGMWVKIYYNFSKLQLKNNFEVCIQIVHNVNFKKGRYSCPCHEGNFTPWICYSRERTPVPKNRILGWSQSQSELWKTEKISLIAGNKILDHPICIQVTVLTTVSQLSTSNMCNYRLWVNIHLS